METDTQQGLTADDIKAIRKADRLVFNYDPLGEILVWAAKDNPKRHEAFEAWDFRVDLTAMERPIVTNYAGRYDTPGVSPTSFTGMVQHDEMVVLRALLKKGDRLQAHWVIANNNDHVTAAALRADEFRVRILRGNKVIEMSVSTVVRPEGDRYCHM